mgnify:FL=1
MRSEQNRVALISIIVEDLAAAEKINNLLSACGQYIVGRMGIPYHSKNVSVMSVVLDAPTEIINSLTGKLGMLQGVSAKTLFSKI